LAVFVRRAASADGRERLESAVTNVVKLELIQVGEGFRFEADAILEAAKGQPFTTIAVMGQLEDGTIWISGNANAGETLVLMERAKRICVFGEDE
jgi:hypothetical protein